MMCKHFGVETRLLEVLREEKTMTAAEVAYRLQLPLASVTENISTLKKNGKVREVTLEQMLAEGK
jgi:DNA-binding IclR family transcriptional regulator